VAGSHVNDSARSFNEKFAAQRSMTRILTVVAMNDRFEDRVRPSKNPLRDVPPIRNTMKKLALPTESGWRMLPGTWE
jgi:hypothetical protein